MELTNHLKSWQSLRMRETVPTFPTSLNGVTFN